MKRRAIAVLLLALAPGLAVAEGCDHMQKIRSSAQCAPGSSWNAATQNCEPQAGA